MNRFVAPVRLCLFTLLALGCAGGSLPAEEESGPAARTWQLPGAQDLPPAVQRALSAALLSRARGYVPRTRHLLEDGSPKYANRLLLEGSPYLQQHAHNPVNWYPWGDEAFETAARLGRPVLLSIGYSTCHWCHVMEEESFEDEEIAAYLNANYVAVKVDREERPDLDTVYMSAVQMISGRGGWPMTTWLTPAREPFFGGTYFPARDGDRGSRKGFLTLLRELKGYYDARPDDVEQRATQITEAIRRSMQPVAGDELPAASLIDAALEQYRAQFDETNGGLNRAPKFPSSLPIRLLLRRAGRKGGSADLDMARRTLRKMADGGMYDQVGGGFHRYSTDAAWLVPHFEKMLYDNASLAMAYLDGYQVTREADFARVAREIFRYVGREMTAEGGAFYSATDADSANPAGEREEGWFFTWTPVEIGEVLGPEDARWVGAYYGVTAGGNFEGRNILHVTRALSEVARRFELDGGEARRRLDGSREKLWAARLRRPAPLRDDKILTSWNGLMISAFARGGFVLDEPDYLTRAARAANFILQHLRREGRLQRSFLDGRARHNAYLDDYAFLIAGLLDLYESTSEPRWLREAISLQSVLDEHYRDAGGGYFMTSDDHETLLAREKPAHDGAEPSGNSITLMNLLRLHAWTGNDPYRSTADSLLRAFGDTLRRAPRALPQMLEALDFRHGSPREVVIVTPESRRGAETYLAVLRESFLPNLVRVVVAEGRGMSEHASLVPPLKGKKARHGRATAYVCQGGVCQLPATDVGAFRAQLGLEPTSRQP